LQVFSAAPSFQSSVVDWGNPDSQHGERYDCYRRISTALLTAQYRALAQMARLAGRSLHLTAVGMGVFRNPPEAFYAAVGAALQELEGSGLEVFLHGYTKNDIEMWNAALVANDYEPVCFGLSAPEFDPVAQTRKVTLFQPISLNSLRHPRISEWLEGLFSHVRDQLELHPEVGRQRIEAWQADPLHVGVRNQLPGDRVRNFFQTPGRYKRLTDKGRDTLKAMEKAKEPVMFSGSLEDAILLPKEPEVTVVLGCPAELLQHWEKANGAIVVSASQFNALESIGGDTSLIGWPNIRAQGAGVAMQAVSAALLRCVAYGQGKLSEGMVSFLQKCKIEDQSVIRKYPGLYLEGKLYPEQITDPKDLEDFSRYVEKNAKELKVPLQYVRCEESGATQLHVFCSAPQWYDVDWNGADGQRTIYYKRISIALLRTQFWFVAKTAKLSGRPLHLTPVGMDTLNNPPEALCAALGVVLQELADTGVEIFLHGYTPEDVDRWNNALVANGYEPVHFETNTQGFSPIARTQKSPPKSYHPVQVPSIGITKPFTGALD
jgi:hypothetical protein